MSDNEFRQKQLLAIRDRFCDGVDARLAEKIGREPSYVSRLFYPPGKAGAKNIGMTITDACSAAFPLPPAYWDASLSGRTAYGQMLTGPRLGAAIRAAIEMKGITQRELALHFGVRAPSIQDWLKHGTIGKDKLQRLWSYFSDVVGPEHWGLDPTSERHLAASPVLSLDEIKLIDAYRRCGEKGREAVRMMLHALAHQTKAAT